MSTAASISIALDAQTAGLKKGFAEARGAIDKLGAGMSGSVASGMAKFHLALAGVKAALGTVKGAINAVVASMADLDATNKFAQRIGIAADQLRILNFAAEQTGASSGTMQMALQRMTRRVNEAAHGSGEAVKALQELGLSAEYLTGLSPDQQFGAIADAMGKVAGQGDKVRLAMKLFDSEGVALVNTLAGGSAGLNEFGQQAQQLGLLMGDNRDKVAGARDAINRMKSAWDGLVARVAVAVAPALERIADVLSKLIGGFNRLFGLGGKAADFGSASTAAAAAFVPVQKELAKVADKVKTDAERAKEIIDKVKTGQQQAMQNLPRIGAVTRGSTEGFAALQEQLRAQREAQRSDDARNILLTKIHEQLKRAGINIAEVTI